MIVANCEFCGNTYNTFKNWYDRVEHHTCSKECRSKLKQKLHVKICKYG